MGSEHIFLQFDGPRYFDGRDLDDVSSYVGSTTFPGGKRMEVHTANFIHYRPPFHKKHTVVGEIDVIGSLKRDYPLLILEVSRNSRKMKYSEFKEQLSRECYWLNKSEKFKNKEASLFFVNGIENTDVYERTFEKNNTEITIGLLSLENIQKVNRGDFIKKANEIKAPISEIAEYYKEAFLGNVPTAG